MFKSFKKESYMALLLFLVGFPLLSFSQDNESVKEQIDEDMSIERIVEQFRFDPYLHAEIDLAYEKEKERAKWYFFPKKIGDRIYNYWIRRSFRILKADASDFYGKLKYLKEHDSKGIPGFIVYSTVNGAVNVGAGVGMLIYNIPVSYCNMIDCALEKDFENAAIAGADGLMSAISAYLVVDGGLQATQATKTFVAAIEANLSKLAALARNFGKTIGNNTPALVGVTSSGTKIFAQPVVLEAEAVGVAGFALGKNALGKNLTGLVFSRSAGFGDDEGGAPIDQIGDEDYPVVREVGDAFDLEISGWEDEILTLYKDAKNRHLSLKSSVNEELEQVLSHQYHPGLIPKSELVNIIYEKLLEFDFDPPVKPLMP